MDTRTMTIIRPSLPQPLTAKELQQVGGGLILPFLIGRNGQVDHGMGTAK